MLQKDNKIMVWKHFLTDKVFLLAKAAPSFTDLLLPQPLPSAPILSTLSTQLTPLHDPTQRNLETIAISVCFQALSVLYL